MSVKSNEFEMSDSKEEDPYDTEKCADWIDACNLNKVCLQFPDNLLPDSAEVALRIESLTNKKVYILGDTSYGSCCIDEIAAQHVNADGIIHFGHACLTPTVRLPVLHVLPKKHINIVPLIDKFTSNFEDRTKRIIFFYDVAYAHKIEDICKVLKPTFENLVISSLNCTSNVEYTDAKEGSCTATLGRNFALEDGCKVDDYEAFFLGEDGKTLATLALSIAARKWYYYERNDIVEFKATNTPWLKRRRYLVEKLKDAKVVGIVIATLGIKEYLEAILMVKNVLKEKNKKSYILSVGKINPAKLANFPEIDAFIAIACPENEIFDSRDFLRPILMPYEVELAFNSSRESYARYCMDFRQILPGGADYVGFKPSTDADISLITGEVRNCDNNVSCTNKMNALAISSTGTIAIGKAGAEFLHNRSWMGVEQRLGKDEVQPAEIGRTGTPNCYENEPILTKEHNSSEK